MVVRCGVVWWYGVVWYVVVVGCGGVVWWGVVRQCSVVWCSSKSIYGHSAVKP